MCEMPDEYFTDEAFFERNEYLLKQIKERFPDADLRIEGPYDIEYRLKMAKDEALMKFKNEFLGNLGIILKKCKSERAFKIQFNKWERFLKANFDELKISYYG